MIDRPIWTEAELDAERSRSTAIFRQQRMLEPLEAYLDVFDEYQGALEDLLERTVDLTRLRTEATNILTDSRLLEAFRYLTGPPISADDLKVVAEATLTSANIRVDADMVGRIVQVILDGLDRRRFPWITEGREATEAERQAAIIASAALIATRRTETARRSVGKTEQERMVEEALSDIGLALVQTRTVRTISQAPRSGEFCRESIFGDRKADFIVVLWDGRIMPVECKVSNSSTNSVKRLNNDAAIKAEVWRKDFGERNVVPTAVLSGVYKLHNLVNAQSRGLTLYWAHHLTAMTNWIQRTKES